MKGSDQRRMSAQGDVLPRNVKGGILVKYDSAKTAWKFVADSVGRGRELDNKREPPSELPVKGLANVMKAVQPRVTVKEVSWILNAEHNQEMVSLQSCVDLMMENADERIDPVQEAFRMICKDTTKGSFVDIAKVCEMYQKLGVTGVDEKFMQEVIDTVVNEMPGSTKRKSRRKIDLATFRRLCCFSPDGEEDGGEGMDSAPMAGMREAPMSPEMTPAYGSGEAP